MPGDSNSNSNLSLGEFLRQERERRGITIEQVASATKIGVRTLHALEADIYAELPAKPFVRGFVNSYARFIGIEPKEILTQYGTFLDSKAMDRPNRESGHSGYAFEKREGDQSRTYLWVSMVVFMVAGGVAAFFFKPRHHHGTHIEKLRAAHPVSQSSSSPTPSPSLIPVAGLVFGPNPSPRPTAAPVPIASASASPAAMVTPSPSPSASPTQEAKAALVPSPSPSPTLSSTPTPTATPVAVAPSPSPTQGEELAFDEKDPLSSGLTLKPSEIKHKVVFKALESAWVRYKVDNRPVMQFVFRDGRVLVLRAKESIRFQVSPPQALTYSYKGGPYKPIQGDQHVVSRQNDATLFFPFEIADSIQEPFPKDKPLSRKAVPLPRVTPSPSPSSP